MPKLFPQTEPIRCGLRAGFAGQQKEAMDWGGFAKASLDDSELIHLDSSIPEKSLICLKNTA